MFSFLIVVKIHVKCTYDFTSTFVELVQYLNLLKINVKSCNMDAFGCKHICYILINNVEYNYFLLSL